MAHLPQHNNGWKKHNCSFHFSDIAGRKIHCRARSNPRPKTRRHPDDMPDPVENGTRSKSVGSKSNRCHDPMTKKKKYEGKCESKKDLGKCVTHGTLKLANQKGSLKSKPSCNVEMKYVERSDETPRNVVQKLPCSVQEHEYLQFLLRITEDIIKNDLYTNKEMKQVFLSHIDANKNSLELDKMLLQIHELMKELNMPFSDTEDDSSHSWTELQNVMKSLVCLCSCDTEEKQNCKCDLKYFGCSEKQVQQVPQLDSVPSEYHSSNYETTNHLEYGKPMATPFCNTCINIKTPVISLDRLTERTEPVSSKATCNELVTSCSTFGNVDVLPGFENLEEAASTMITCDDKNAKGSTSPKSCQKPKKSKSDLKSDVNKPERPNTAQDNRYLLESCRMSPDICAIQPALQHVIAIQKDKDAPTVCQIIAPAPKDESSQCKLQMSRKRSRSSYTKIDKPKISASEDDYLIVQGPVHLLKSFIDQHPDLLAKLKVSPSKQVSSLCLCNAEIDQAVAAAPDEIDPARGYQPKCTEPTGTDLKDAYAVSEYDPECVEIEANRLLSDDYDLTPQREIEKLTYEMGMDKLLGEDYDLPPKVGQSTFSVSEFYPSKAVQTDDSSTWFGSANSNLLQSSELMREHVPIPAPLQNQFQRDEGTDASNDLSNTVRLYKVRDIITSPPTTPPSVIIDTDQVNQPPNIDFDVIHKPSDSHSSSIRDVDQESLTHQTVERAELLPSIDVQNDERSIEKYTWIEPDTDEYRGYTSTPMVTMPFTMSLNIQNMNDLSSIRPNGFTEPEEELDNIDEMLDKKARRVSILKNPLPKFDVQPTRVADEDEAKAGKKGGESIIKTVEVIKGRQIIKDKMIGMSILKDLEMGRELRAAEMSKEVSGPEYSNEVTMSSVGKEKIPRPESIQRLQSKIPASNVPSTGVQEKNSIDEIYGDYDIASYNELPINISALKEKERTASNSDESVVSLHMSELVPRRPDFLPELDVAPEVRISDSQTQQIKMITAKLDQFRKGDETVKDDTEISTTLNELVEKLKEKQELDNQVVLDLRIEEDTSDGGNASKPKGGGGNEAKYRCCRFRRAKKVFAKTVKGVSDKGLTAEDYKHKSARFDKALASLSRDSSRTSSNNIPAAGYDDEDQTERSSNSSLDTNRKSLVRISGNKENDVINVKGADT